MGQALVDAAFFTSALLRAPDALWKPKSLTTKRGIVSEIKGLRRIDPPYQNWILFASINEAFLYSAGEEWEPMRVHLSIRRSREWYVSVGWHRDGDGFHFDY